MSDPVIGIDLGTTYSCVAFFKQNGVVEVIANSHGNRTTPSYVAFNGTERLIGQAAKDQAGTNPSNTVFDAKRLTGRKFHDVNVREDCQHFPFKVVDIKNKPWVEVKVKNEPRAFSPEQISAMILESLRDIARNFTGNDSLKKAVITVPAYFNNSQRQATKDAGHIAGLEVLRVINEPTAAGIAFGFNNESTDSKDVLVFDLGGGTFDVSILRIHDGVYEVLSTAGDAHLGGEDFDTNVVNFLVADIKNRLHKDLTPKGLFRLRKACEAAKRNLTTNEQTTISVDSLLDGNDYNKIITRGKFVELNKGLFDKLEEPIRKALEDANLTPENIDNVVLVGGSSRILQVQKMIRGIFPDKPINKNINPDEAVAYGAAIVGAYMNQDKHEKLRNFQLKDVIPLSLGLEMHGGMMNVLIRRNTGIPANAKEYLTTNKDDQTAITITVYEGERPIAKENNCLGRFVIKGIQPARHGVPKIEVTFMLNEDGILEVSATDTQNEEVRATETIPYGKDRFSEAEIQQMILDAKHFAEDDHKERQRIRARLQLEDYCLHMKTSQPVIGIDLGTTNCCVAFYRNGRAETISNENSEKTTPSYVAFTENERLIGPAAKKQAGTNSENTVFNIKRLIGKTFEDTEKQENIKHWPFKVVDFQNKPVVLLRVNKYPMILLPEQLLSMLLGKMRDIANAYFGDSSVKRAVITVPAYFNDSQRQATKDAGEIAGLEVISMINEPIAAGIAYGFQNDFTDPENILIFDLGGGTFDVTILRIHKEAYKVLSTAGDTHLGGEDFDDNIMKPVLEEVVRKNNGQELKPTDLYRLRMACEEAKRIFTSNTMATISVEALLPNNADYRKTLSRAFFEAQNEELFKRLNGPIDTALKDAKLKAADINSIVFVGGSSRIVRIQEMIQERFPGKRIRREIQPEEAVACGAAILGAHFSGIKDDKLKNFELKDVIPFSLWVEMYGGEMCVLIRRNTCVPVEATLPVTTNRDNQTEINIVVYEGERKLVKENKRLRKVTIKGIEPQSRGFPRIEITICVNLDGILTVSAKDKRSDRILEREIEYNNGRLSEEYIQKLVQDAKKFEEADRNERECIPKIQEMLKKKFPRSSINKDINPDEAVAHGAAIQAAKLVDDRECEALQEMTLMDVTPLSLGVETAGGLMSVVIPRNTTVPVTKTKIFSPYNDGQTAVQVKVYEGERPQTKENNLLGDFKLTGIRPTKSTKFEVAFNVDSNGILNVTAKELGDGTEKTLGLTYQMEMITKDEEVQEMIQKAKDLRLQGEKEKERAQAKVNLETLCLRYQSELRSSQAIRRVPGADQEKVFMEVAIVLSWLESNPGNPKEDYEKRYQQLHDTCEPIRHQLYDDSWWGRYDNVD